jgi:hypothetical protein
MGLMRIIDETGDTVVTWGPDDPATIAEAAAIFRRLDLERRMAFARPAGAPASEAERIHAFDPHAEEIIWVRPIQGG